MSSLLPQNRARFDLRELVAATAARPRDLPGDLLVHGISTDSRTVESGQLFVALRGERFDGHSFVDEARARGAIPLVEERAGAIGPRLEVDDSLAALGSLAGWHLERARRSRNLPVLAIGGAAGKTTTRSLAAAGAEAVVGPVLATTGNLNNRIGVPLTLLALEDRHHAVVVECGTSLPGEIRALGSMVQPDVALVLNAGLEHSEHLGGPESIVEEEGSLFAFARKATVTSESDPRLIALARRRALPVWLFGTGSECAVRIVHREISSEGKSHFRFEIRRTESPRRTVTRDVSSPLYGFTAAQNCAAALAGLLALLPEAAEPDRLDRALLALGQVRPIPGRLFPHQLPNGALLLDDSYNANPGSVRSSLQAASELARARGGRLHVLLGDMLELGIFEQNAHQEMLYELARLAPASAVLVGPRFATALAVAAALPAVSFSSSEAAAERLDLRLEAPDVALLKGSRGMKMERLLDSLDRAARA